MSDPGFTVITDDTYKDLLRIKQQRADLLTLLKHHANHIQDRHEDTLNEWARGYADGQRQTARAILNTINQQDTP